MISYAYQNPYCQQHLAIAVLTHKWKADFDEAIKCNGIYPCFSDKPSAIMPALEPVSVPFPPKPAPKTKAPIEDLLLHKHHYQTPLQKWIPFGPAWKLMVSW